MRKLAIITALSFVAFAGMATANPPLNRYIVHTDSDAVNEAARQGVENHGGMILKDFAHGGLVVLIPEQAIGPLGNIQGVVVEPDVLLHAVAQPAGKGKPSKDPPLQPDQVLPWGIDRIDAELASSTVVVGLAAVNVVIIDTGIMKDHADLAVTGGINFVRKGRRAVKPDAWGDDHGHGTHVAGTVAALDNSIGVLGTAPGVNLYAAKVLDKTGSGFISDIIDAILWSIDRMDVINMSLGIDKDILDQYPSTRQAFQDAVDSAHDSGIVIVAAAGNSGLGTDTVIYPARFASVIAVAAIDITDARALFSSTGPDVEVSGPGVGIFSTTNDGLYGFKNGTSMASPHVAGTAALFIASGVADTNDNGRINDEVRLMIQATAEDLGNPEWFGFGLVDAEITD